MDLKRCAYVISWRKVRLAFSCQSSWQVAWAQAILWAAGWGRSFTWRPDPPKKNGDVPSRDESQLKGTHSYQPTRLAIANKLQVSWKLKRTFHDSQVTLREDPHGFSAPRQS